MRLVDSHCHLDDDQFDEDREQVIGRAREAGVERMMTIDAPEFAESYDFMFSTIGVHPHEASTADLGRIREFAKHPKVLAVGEIGLDYHYDFSPREVQREVFEEQLAIAAGAGKPIVIHTREAWEDTMAMLRGWTGGGIMHCFTGTPDQAREALGLGFHLAFGGVVTFPKAAEVREAARITPEDRLLIETDCPYLAPVPFRGKRNEPAFVARTLQTLAECHGIQPDAMASQVRANFWRFLGRGDAPA